MKIKIKSKEEIIKELEGYKLVYSILYDSASGGYGFNINMFDFCGQEFDVTPDKSGVVFIKNFYWERNWYTIVETRPKAVFREPKYDPNKKNRSLYLDKITNRLVLERDERIDEYQNFSGNCNFVSDCFTSKIEQWFNDYEINSRLIFITDVPHFDYDYPNWEPSERAKRFLELHNFAWCVKEYNKINFPGGTC